MDRKDNSGRTPLALAAERGYASIVDTLLDGCACASYVDQHGQTPLSLAASRGHKEVVELLLANEYDCIEENAQDALICAAEMGQDEILKILLRTGYVHVNETDCYGRRALSVAIEGGHKETLKLLLTRANDPVDVNVKDSDGRSPLMVAVTGKAQGIVKDLLTMCKIDVNTKDDNEWTPLCWALSRGDKRMIALLLAADADRESTTIDGQTAAMLAAANGHEGLARILAGPGHVGLDHSSNMVCEGRKLQRDVLYIFCAEGSTI